ncbi:MAG: hypothetical protein QGF46_07375 [Planctomycetota bacterium]|jgi:hypothetical protein|nr:hypothetical protein [Planctomycetota bacterium]
MIQLRDKTTTPFSVIKETVTKGALLLLLASCAKQQPFSELAWDTPPLPQGAVFYVDDIQVEDDVLNNFLTRPWSELCARHGANIDVAQLEQELFSDPKQLMTPLVRAELLLREAEQLFPELDSHELDYFQETMEMNVGSALEALHNRYGPEGWQRHVNRQFRLNKLHQVFKEYAVTVSDKEVHDYYTEVTADLPPVAEREQQNFSYDYLEPMLRQKLEKDAITAAEESWLDEQIRQTSAVLKLRNGKEVIIY